MVDTTPIQQVIDDQGMVHIRQSGSTICGIEFFGRSLIQTVQYIDVDCDYCKTALENILREVASELTDTPF